MVDGIIDFNFLYKYNIYYQIQMHKNKINHLTILN